MKGLAIILLLVVETIGFVYAASRTVHFIELSLPPDGKFWAYLALAVLDVALITWTVVALFKSDGFAQEGIAILMIIINFAGMFAGVATDTFYQSGQNGVIAKLPAETVSITTWIMLFVIVANMGAFIGFYMADPDLSLERSKRRIEYRYKRAQLKGMEYQANKLAQQYEEKSGITYYWDEAMAKGIVSPNQPQYRVSQPLQFEQPTQAAMPVQWQPMPEYHPTRQPIADGAVEPMHFETVPAPTETVPITPKTLADYGVDRDWAQGMINKYQLDTADKAYVALSSAGRVPAGMTKREFERLYNENFTQP